MLTSSATAVLTDALRESRAAASPTTDASGVDWLMMDRPEPGEVHPADVEQHQRRLVDAARAREERVWSALFDENFQTIYRFALFRLRDPQAAEDLAAQTFNEALRGIDRFEYRGVSIRAWLFRIARNLLADHFRQALRERQVSPPDLVAQGNELEAAGVRLDLIDALSKLPDDQQTVVTLTLVEDLSCDECAQVLRKKTREIERLQLAGLNRLRVLLEFEKAAAS